MTDKYKRPSLWLSLLPIATLVGLLAIAIYLFQGDALGGASQIVLLLATALCTAIAYFCYGVSWAVIEAQIAKNIYGIAPSVLILLLIGTLSGTWMISGVVPSLIYYGLQVMQTDFFSVACCVLCSIASVMTGSSWTTVATIGIALMGIGQALGFSEGWIAGAIISGAYFGDKISPLSDTTVMAAGVTDVPLFSHIRYMLLTTVPSMAIALIIFIVSGLMHGVGNVGDTTQFTTALASRFHITPWLLLVPLLTGVMIARRWPPLVTLFLSTLLAMLFGLFFQTDVLRDIHPDLFKASMMSMYGSTSLPTSNAMLSGLIATRGMAGMMDTIWLIVCAMCFGATMSAGGMVGGITRLFVRMVRGRTSLVAATVCSGLMFNLAVADQYLCILLTGNVFRDVYDRQGFERRLLSRSTEDAVTVTSVLVPWNTCGMTQSTVLGVSTFVYLPYCFFNLLSPLMSIIVAAIGYKVVKLERENYKS